MKRKLKNVGIALSILVLLVFGVSLLRYGQSEKHLSADGQYSFYSKRSLFGGTVVSMPGGGNRSAGSIYVYDEVEKKVIFRFESTSLRSDMEASEFSNYDGGVFNCKSGHYFKLPRPLKATSDNNDHDNDKE